MDKNSKPNRKRGRKSDSTSFVKVKLSELNRVLRAGNDHSSGAYVPVWGKYAEMVGLEGVPIKASKDNLEAAVAQGKLAGVSVIEFAEDGSQTVKNPDRKLESVIENPKQEKDEDGDPVPKAQFILKTFDE